MNLSIEKQTQIFYLSVVLVFIVNYLFGSSVFPLFDLDEGAYAEVSREMVVNGNYWQTMVNGIPFYDKPAFMYWVQALSVNIFGSSEFAYRFPSVVALGFWLFLLYRFAEKHLGLQVARYTVILAMTSAGVTVLFKSAIPDAFLNLFITATLFQVYDYLQDKQQKRLFYAWAFMALGVLTKGPIAMVIPFFTVFLFLLLKKRLAEILTMMFYWRGWVIFLLIALPWYIVQYVQFGDAFIAGFFGKHNVGRFMHAMEGHSGGVWFYVLALFLLALPFIAPLLKAFSKIKQVQSQQVLLFLWLWFAFVWLFFTLSATKLPHYLMYGMNPVWIILAYYLLQLKNRFWLLLPSLFLVALVLAFPALIDAMASNYNDSFVQQTYQGVSRNLPQGFYAVSLFSIVAMIIVFFIKAFSAPLKGVIFAFFCSLVITFAFLPLIGSFQQGVSKQAANYTREHNLDVVVWGLNKPSFNVYAQRISRLGEPGEGEWVLSKSDNLKKLKQVEIIINSRGIALARVIKK